VTLTRSELEAVMLQLCIDHGLPRPAVNRYRDGRELDFRWSAARLVVETDGWGTHGTRAAFEADRARDRRLAVEGWRVIRVTHRQLRDDRDAVAADVRTLLR
jgi:very-short-patch-repair endonuclease